MRFAPVVAVLAACGGLREPAAPSPCDSPAARTLPTTVGEISLSRGALALRADGTVLGLGSVGYGGPFAYGVVLPDAGVERTVTSALPTDALLSIAADGDRLLVTSIFRSGGDHAMAVLLDEARVLDSVDTVGLWDTAAAFGGAPALAVLDGFDEDPRFPDSVVKPVGDSLRVDSLEMNGYVCGRLGDDLISFDVTSPTLRRTSLDGGVRWSQPISVEPCGAIGTGGPPPMAWTTADGGLRFGVCWTMVGVDPQTGAPWPVQTPTARPLYPLDDGDLLVAGDHRLARITPDGTERWTVAAPDSVWDSSEFWQGPSPLPFQRSSGAPPLYPLRVGGSSVIPQVQWIDVSSGQLCGAAPR